MAELTLLFWNVSNLFEAGVVDRGPQTDAELDARVERIGEVIEAVNPHLIGLAEVQTEELFGRVESLLTRDYASVWEPGPPVGSVLGTGLGVLGDKTIFASVDALSVHRPTVGSRPRSLLVEVELATGGTFLFSVNHWKSRMERAGSPPTSADRNETAEWLGDLLASYDKTDCAVVVGDFNAEPWEPAFNDFRLRSKRTFSGALWAGQGSSPAYLYNAAWRFAPEPAFWDDVRKLGSGYVEPRPKTTHDTSPPVLFDHLLVSRAGLRNGPITFVESELRYVRTLLTSQTTSGGVHRPLRWSWDATLQQGTGASDHYPLQALFRY